MGNNKFFIINLLIGFAIVSLHFFLNVPFWMLLMIFVPTSIIGMIIYSSMYNFRKDLQFEPVDRVKFDERTRQLETDTCKVLNLGFNKIDEFYLQLIPDSITYVFKHVSEPVYMNLYHMGPKIVPDVITLFENGYYLTTGATPDAGNIPRENKEFLQIFENLSYENLYEEHRKSVEFLKSKNLNTREVSQPEFRDEFMKSLRVTGERIMSYPAWPLLLLFWVVTVRGKIHKMSIEKQVESGKIRVD